jgi:hypothetical protein
LNFLLEFLDLRFVTGDKGLDKVTSWHGLRWEFEAMLLRVHPIIWPENAYREILDGV